MNMIFLEMCLMLLLQNPQIPALPANMGDGAEAWRWIVSALVVILLGFVIEIKIRMRDDKRRLIEKEIALVAKDALLFEATSRFNEKYLQMIRENVECRSKSTIAMDQLTRTVEKIDETMNAILENISHKIISK